MSEAFDWKPPTHYNFARHVINRWRRKGPMRGCFCGPSHRARSLLASPDATRGEVVKAFFVLAADHSPSDQLAAALQDHVKRTPAPYKYPRRIEFVGSLPKTISGKELRDDEFRYWEFSKADA